MQKFLMIILAFVIAGVMSVINAYSDEKPFTVNRPKTVVASLDESKAPVLQNVQAEGEMTESQQESNQVPQGNMSARAIYQSCKGYFEHHFNTKERTARKSTCTGYFYGIGSTLLILQAHYNKTGMCLPMNISTEDIVKVFLEWGKRQEPKLHEYIATQGVLEALKQRYTCAAIDKVY